MLSIKFIVFGILYSIALVLPGFGGATVAMVCGFYEKLIHCVGRFIRDFKKNLPFLLPFIIGMVLGIILTVLGLDYLITNYEIIFTFGIVGLIIGSVPSIYKKSRIKFNSLRGSHVIPFCLAGLTMVILAVSGVGGSIELGVSTPLQVINQIWIGFVSSVGPMIPGVSGGTLLMVFCGAEGYVYITGTLRALQLFDLIPYVIGVLLGVALLAKFMKMCFTRFPDATYSAILGAMIFSIVPMLDPLYAEMNKSLMHGLLCAIVCLACAVTVYILLYYANRKEQTLDADTPSLSKK